MKKCQICTHDMRYEIDRAILAGQTQSRISQNYGVTVDAVRNHAANHLSTRMVKAFKTKEALTDLNMMQEFTTLIADIKSQINKLKKSGKDGLTIAATNTLIKLYGVMSQFAAVFFTAQANEANADNADNEAKEIELSQQQLSMLTLQELLFLQKIAKKINTGNKQVILPEITQFDTANFAYFPEKVEKDNPLLNIVKSQQTKPTENKPEQKPAMKRKYPSKDESLQVYPIAPELISRQKRTLQ